MSAHSLQGELDGYFAEAARWDADRMAAIERNARLAWRVAAAGWLCAVSSGCALLLLMPLKRIDPFVIRVDNSTGVVDVVPVYAGAVAMDEAVTRYFLTHYVTVCQRFNFSTAESDYEECGAFHTAQRNQAWYALWQANNPNSPLNLHRDGSLTRAQVQSVSFFERASGVSDLAQVRYMKSELPAGKSESRAGSPRFSMPTQRHPRIRSCGAGIPSDSRSLSSARSRRFPMIRRRRHRARPRKHPHEPQLDDC